MDTHIYGLEGGKEISRFEIMKGKRTIDVVVLESIDGLEANFCLASRRLSTRKKIGVETAIYSVSSNIETSRIKGIGHGWKNEYGTFLPTCEGKITFSCISSSEPVVVLMEHYKPNVGKKIILYIDQETYLKEKIDLEAMVPFDERGACLKEVESLIDKFKHQKKRRKDA